MVTPKRSLLDHRQTVTVRHKQTLREEKTMNDWKKKKYVRFYSYLDGAYVSVPAPKPLNVAVYMADYTSRRVGK